jgi:Flp pilus assembly protein TadG
MSRNHHRRDRGQILVMTALLLLVLVGGIGLALDSGVGYLIKARLNSAVDAAGVAAARAVSIGANQDEQAANARVAAIEFFNANYPANYWYSTATLNDPGITFAQGKVTIDISASASVPVHFMQVMGFDLLNVGAQAQVVRKDLDMAFVVDTTASMASVGPAVRSAAVSFLGHFSPTTDRVALIHFSHGAVVDVPIKADQSRGFDRPTMTARINALAFNGNTNFAEGMWHARDQLQNKISPINRSSLRVIVFFSDGAPNTFASRFTFNPASYCTQTGAIQTSEPDPGTANGLWAFDRQSTALTGNCYPGNNIIARLAGNGMPAWYNAHNLADQEFAVVTNAPRVVTATPNANNVNNASRNLPEAMAARAREEGIYIFTLGLGDNVHSSTGSPGYKTTGETLLKCMANTTDSLARCRNPNRPTGMYCWAATENDLKPCFSKLASEIMRITR